MTCARRAAPGDRAGRHPRHPDHARRPAVHLARSAPPSSTSPGSASSAPSRWLRCPSARASNCRACGSPPSFRWSLPWSCSARSRPARQAEPGQPDRHAVVAPNGGSHETHDSQSPSIDYGERHRHVARAWRLGAPGLRRRGGAALDRQRVPAVDALQGRADEGDAVVHQRREAVPGMEINVVSETITTHEYEARTLAKAFTEITGIKVKHDLIQEGDVVEKIQTQMQSGRNIYDAWINDSDLIGTHFRYKQAVQPDRLDGRRGQGRHPADARRQRLHRQVVHARRRTASCTSCPTSSSRTSTGSATTGSPAPTSRRTSRPSTATSSACR